MSKKITDKFFRLAVESSFNHVILTDEDGVIQYANDSVERITGYKKKGNFG